MTKTTSIQQEATATLRRLEKKDPGLKQLLKEAYAYAVFPSVGKASLVVGGAYGKGAVFERGKFVGYATLGQTTIGVQIGGDTFTELIVFDDKQSFITLKRGKMAFAADASAVLVKAGAAAARGFGKGTHAFVYGDGGMLLEAAIGGQKFKFKPAGRGGEDEEEQSASKDQGGDEKEGATGGIGSIAAKSLNFIKEHPVITTVAGVGAAAGIAMLVFWKLGSSDSSENESDDDAQQKEDSDQEMSADQGEEQQSDEDSDDEDSGDQKSQSGGNGRSRFASAGRHSQ